jgi:hypothetical protein
MDLFLNHPAAPLSDGTSLFAGVQLDTRNSLHCVTDDLCSKWHSTCSPRIFVILQIIKKISDVTLASALTPRQCVCVILPVYSVSHRCQHLSAWSQSYCPQFMLAHMLCKYAEASTEVSQHRMQVTTVTVQPDKAIFTEPLPSNYRGGFTDTTATWSHNPSLFFQNKESRLKDPSHLSVCRSVYPLSLLGNGSVETLLR